MQFALVKNRKGKRVVCWGSFLKVALLMLVIPTAASSGMYYLITKRWNALALYGGLAAGAATTIVVLIFALATPLHKLQFDTDHK
jgi:hypothetical protein